MLPLDGGWNVHEMSLWIAFGITVLMLLARGQMRSVPGPGAPARTARQLLERRYAAGEVDHATYLKMRRGLRAG